MIRSLRNQLATALLGLSLAVGLTGDAHGTQPIEETTDQGGTPEDTDTGDAPPSSEDPPAGSEEEPAPPRAADTVLSEYRTPFPTLTERVIGTASRPTKFDWRQTDVHVGWVAAHLYEFNNFDSWRFGALARVPKSTVIYEFGVSWTTVSDTTSSDLLALTPYRQPGRPSRLSIDFNVGFPLAEGVVTVAPRWFPALELVTSAYAGLRYALYPGSLSGLKLRDAIAALVSPTLQAAEIENLEDRRRESMRVDPARYTPMIGIGSDIYLRQGIFINPRASMAVPLFAPVSQTRLLWWSEFSLAAGVAF